MLFPAGRQYEKAPPYVPVVCETSDSGAPPRPRRPSNRSNTPFWTKPQPKLKLLTTVAASGLSVSASVLYTPTVVSPLPYWMPYWHREAPLEELVQPLA